MRKVGERAEIYNYIYVLSSWGELAGVLSLRELILAAPDTRLDEIMNSKVIAVPADMDQEEAARVIAQYDFVALPVVSSTGRMVGVITVDDVLDIIEEEATEDIQLLGAASPWTPLPAVGYLRPLPQADRLADAPFPCRHHYQHYP